MCCVSIPLYLHNVFLGGLKKLNFNISPISCIIFADDILWPSGFNPASLITIIQVIWVLVKVGPALGTAVLRWSLLCHVIWVCLWWAMMELGWEKKRKWNRRISKNWYWSCPLWMWLILQDRILEWIAFPFSRGSSQPRDQTQISHTAGRFFTSWATREAQEYWSG